MLLSQPSTILMTLTRPSICLLKIFVKKWSRSCRLLFNRSHKGCCAELDVRYASTSELITDLEKLLNEQEVQQLQLTRIQTPEMKGTSLEQLKRVWEKYTSEVRDSNDTYTHSPDDDDPTKPWQMQATAAVQETWNKEGAAKAKEIASGRITSATVI